MKEFLVVVVHDSGLTPSRLYKVEASTKAVAAKRALTKATAENPHYTAFTATVDTLTARKITRFNRKFGEMRGKIYEWADMADYFNRVADVNKRRCAFEEMRCAIADRNYFRNKIETFENHWLKMLELNHVING